tara:strand:- start:4680 stop:5378 length:699 start_codon:yes stop_codon:yes gene_type:complete
MALPKINVPTYELTIPSTQQQVTYRPFLVKEEKILLMANQDENDTDQMIRAMRQIINNCILMNNFDSEQLPIFDIEYIFLKLRAKSVGEISEVGFRCPKCETINKVEINLEQVEVKTFEDHTNQIQLTDTIGVILKYPDMDSISGETEVENVMNILSKSIESIYEKDEIHSASDYKPEEISEFIDGLTQDQFEKMQKFFETMPKLSHETEYVCSNCNHHQKLVIEGLQNFFG